MRTKAIVTTTRMARSRPRPRARSRTRSRAGEFRQGVRDRHRAQPWVRDRRGDLRNLEQLRRLAGRRGPQCQRRPGAGGRVAGERTGEADAHRPVHLRPARLVHSRGAVQFSVPAGDRRGDLVGGDQAARSAGAGRGKNSDDRRRGRNRRQRRHRLDVRGRQGRHQRARRVRPHGVGCAWCRRASSSPVL